LDLEQFVMGVMLALVLVGLLWQRRCEKRRLHLLRQQMQSRYDSLLQGFTGIVWRMEAAAKQLPEQPAAARMQLQAAIVSMDEQLLAVRSQMKELGDGEVIVPDARRR
jgi:hypothetical protein